MTIEFRCGACQKLLRTGDDKAGATATCPQCGSPVTVPAAAPLEPAEPPPEAVAATGADEPEWSPPPLPSRSSGGERMGGGEPAAAVEQAERPEATGPTRPCPMCGEPIRTSAVRCRFCGETVAGTAPGTPGQIDIGQMFNVSWKIFQREMGMCLAVVWLPSIVVGTIFGALYVASIVAMVATMAGPGGGGGPPDPATIVGVGLVFLLVVVGLVVLYSWLTAGMNVALLRIVRGERAEITDLFRGGRYVLRMMGNGFLLFLVALAEYAGCAVVTIAPAFALGGDKPEAMLIGMLLFYPLLIAVLLFTQGAIWPWQYVLVDRDSPGIGCLTESWELTKGQRLMSLVVLLLVGAVAAAGQMAFCIGMIFTLPFSMVMTTVAYCQLAGHPTSGE